MSSTKMLGSLSALGFVLGLVFALEFVFVTDQHRRTREQGAELADLAWAAIILTPGKHYAHKLGPARE